MIDESNNQVGVIKTYEAVGMARDAGLDLVEVSPNADPPVCRIMDYSKYKYEQEKKAKEARKHQKIIHLKEIKIKPRIEEHDYQVKLYHLKRFLARGDRAKLTMVFRGREMSHVEIGRKVIDRVVSDLVDIGEVEKGPTRDGRNIMVFFVPRTSSKAKK